MELPEEGEELEGAAGENGRSELCIGRVERAGGTWCEVERAVVGVMCVGTRGEPDVVE